MTFSNLEIGQEFVFDMPIKLYRWRKHTSTEAVVVHALDGWVVSAIEKEPRMVDPKSKVVLAEEEVP